LDTKEQLPYGAVEINDIISKISIEKNKAGQCWSAISELKLSHLPLYYKETCQNF